VPLVELAVLADGCSSGVDLISQKWAGFPCWCAMSRIGWLSELVAWRLR
jgi:hypothetical protein